VSASRISPTQHNTTAVIHICSHVSLSLASWSSLSHWSQSLGTQLHDWLNKAEINALCAAHNELRFTHCVHKLKFKGNKMAKKQLYFSISCLLVLHAVLWVAISRSLLHAKGGDKDTLCLCLEGHIDCWINSHWWKQDRQHHLQQHPQQFSKRQPQFSLPQTSLSSA